MRHLLLIHFVSISSIVMAQDCFDRLEKVISVRDSMGRVIEDMHVKIDSLNKLNNHQREELQENITVLEKQSQGLQRDLRKLDKGNLVLLEKNIREKSDSIKYLMSTIRDKDTRMLESRQKCEERIRVEQENGRKEIRDQINRTYGLPMDSLLSNYILMVLERDRVFLKDSVTRSRLEVLMLHQKVRGVLAERYNEARVTEALLSLKRMEIEPEGFHLQQLLQDYKYRSDRLRGRVQEIISVDARFLADDFDKEIRERKLEQVMIPLAGFIRDVEFSFKDYPYLGGIIQEILQRKRANVDADISDILSRI